MVAKFPDEIQKDIICRIDGYGRSILGVYVYYKDTHVLSMSYLVPLYMKFIMEWRGLHYEQYPASRAHDIEGFQLPHDPVYMDNRVIFIFRENGNIACTIVGKNTEHKKHGKI